jgi:hypothetical protein
MVVFLRDLAASRENHAFPDIEKSDEPKTAVQNNGQPVLLFS